MNTTQIAEFGGLPTRQKDTTHVVSFWHIPGGCDYSNAEVFYAYFSEEEKARAFAKKYENIPEMANLITIENMKVSAIVLKRIQ